MACDHLARTAGAPDARLFGRAGYRIDSTHRTFIDRAMLADAGAVEGTGFALERARYFPGNLRVIGDWFPHHELQALYLAR